MAEGRMLKKKISLNEAVADLANDTHRLLFTWGIAHLDVEGRITGNLRGFRGLVVPLLDHITPETIQGFFQDAESLGLIQRYEVDGEWHVQYPKFAHNQNLNRSREAASKRPPPPPDYQPGPPAQPLIEDSVNNHGELNEHSMRAPGEVKLREVKGREVNTKASAFVIGLADDPQRRSTNSKLKPVGLVNLWNDLGCRPMVSELTDERRKKASLRLRKRGDPDWWRKLFEKARELNKPWLTFDFLMRNDTNCLKVLEGNYDHDFGNRGNGPRAKTGSPGKRTPRGYDQRRDQYVVEVPDPD